jgi:hypothetical protein
MSRKRLMRIGRVLAVAVLGVLLAAAAEATPAFARAPRWRLSAATTPTNMPPGGEGKVLLLASNLGDASVDAAGAPVSFTDTLPPGLSATAISGASHIPGTAFGFSGSSGAVKCELSTLSCAYEGTLAPYGWLEVTIAVKVAAQPPASGTNEVRIAGGGAPPTTVAKTVTFDGAPTPFGIEAFEFAPESEDGSLDTQAGSHPFQLTSTIALNQAEEVNRLFGLEPKPPALARNLRFDLPPGLVGNATAIPRCTELQFESYTEVRGKEGSNLCPPDTAVGVATVTAVEPANLGVLSFAVPVFNLEPAEGEPARFGFIAGKDIVVLDTAVRTGGDYGVTVTVSNITQAVDVLSSSLTLWGVPGDPRHDQSRGWACLSGGASEASCSTLGEQQPPPFLTLPTSCTAPLRTTVQGESWPTAADPAGISLAPFEASSTLAPFPPSSSETLEGCGQLPFSPSISTEPDEHAGSTPTGLNVDVHVPQQSTLESTLEEAGKAEADVKDTTVTLPEGMLLSPSAAYGLLTCSGEQVGFDGGEKSPAREESVQSLGENDNFGPGAASCPEAAKVGAVEIETPLLAHKLKGSVYLASQDTDPFQAPLMLYLIARDPVSGVLVKLAGKVTPSPTTGQLVSTFEDTPQQPFEDLRLHFFGGQRASLSTPALCGPHTTTASFTPWSTGEAAPASSSFNVTSGPGGGACSTDPQPFAPSLQAGSNGQAGAFTPFTLSIGNPDGDQALSGLAVHLPAGVAALLSSVTPCPEPPAGQQWTCGPESLIGHSTASSGLGGEPYTLGGAVYLTSGYDGAPFGLLVATEAKAGPFNLGMLDVRSQINVDPNTAAVTITTDPGPRGEALPTILKGVPVQLKHLEVTVDRAGFQFNPTNCNATAVTGTLNGAQGATEGVSYPFTVSNCAALPFKPTLTASSGGKASKANGASLDVKITSAGLGQANIAKVVLTLPKALPSRLTTLQKACVDAVFNVNPAACDEGSVIGTATIHTPVLKSPLTGPAYLVSHGGAAFPDVEFVLQGEGITLILDGKTQIKNGVTYSRFESAPDAPFTSFETVLPTGPHSALTANVPAKDAYSLCKTSLVMPTEITGQNGDLIKQSTKINVTGCKASKPLTRAQKLTKALTACKKKYKHSKKKQAACVKQARSKYGPKAKAKKPAKKSTDSKGRR